MAEQHPSAMSHPHAIDCDDPLFDFDSFEAPDASVSNHQLLVQCYTSASTEHPPALTMSTGNQFTATSTVAECVQYHPSGYICEQTVFGDVGEDPLGKGKAPSRPLDIQPRDTSQSHFDQFSFSPVASGNFMDTVLASLPSSSNSTPQTIASFAFSPHISSDFAFSDFLSANGQPNFATPGTSYGDDIMQTNFDLVTTDKGKGKAAEPVPCLPPLSFSPAEFSQGETCWPILDPTTESEISLPHPSSADVGAGAEQSSSASSKTLTLSRAPSRRHSFSSLSTHSAKSLAARSISKFKVKLGKNNSGGNLARRLLLRKRDGLTDNYSSYDNAQMLPDSEGSNSFLTTSPHARSAFDFAVSSSIYGAYSAPASPQSRTHFEHRGMIHLPLNSSPLLQDVATMDSVHTLPSDLFMPIRLMIRNLFDTMLPKELQLQVLKSLIVLHEIEGERSCQQSNWTAKKTSSSKYRWVGRDKGIVELITLSRVSKSWQCMVFDGQIWSNMDLKSFPDISMDLLLRITSSSGQFVRSIDFTGHARLRPSTFTDIIQCIIYSPTELHSPITQLTHVNLSGCSALTSSVLHDLLKRSPALRDLRLRGSTVITNGICEVLGSHCKQLLILDLSRCPNMDATGITSLILQQDDVIPLAELRIAGIRRVTDDFMGLLGSRLRSLEVLDLSGARELRDSALDAFVTCPEKEFALLEQEVRGIILTSREAGRDPGDPTKYRRRVTQLKHLSLSNCPLLSDDSCSSLAYAVPKLEYLEMACIGAELKDDGLVRLLKTTPLIRRLDLEEASELTDAVLEALTPQSLEEMPRQGSNHSDLSTGAALESLILSYAVNLSNEALLALIRACTKLRVLELDNTRVSASVIKEFVKVSRRRQMVDSSLVVIDCRGVNEGVVKELSSMTRTRKGWRSWEARKLGFLDGRDEENLGVGQDECDGKKVAVKSFYSWQTVDAVDTAREKRRKARRGTGRTSRSPADESQPFTKGSSRWWVSGRGRVSGSNSPNVGDHDRDSCVIM
ncbi:RNI-like protein [Rickenella mellea]|uniref:RNI-like protein n=1 Tax=Rickenella mellea TaxID=50990 RepID=A0A4Y7QM61_9AGAM|nr:RNI-like protein [Rickenella mellea]